MMIYPTIKTLDERPPTIYNLMQSIANYGNDDKIIISDLPRATRTKFFDFYYPLSGKIIREDFETMILKHYITRRIGFDTLTLFKIKLDSTLNEIMPYYNTLIDALHEWDSYGEQTTTERTTEDKKTANTETQTKSNTKSNVIDDNRSSELPQGEIGNVKAGTYLTDYNLRTADNTAEDESQSTGNATDNTQGKENIINSRTNKLQSFTVLTEKLQGIYTNIFKDLDSLFYQLV